MSSVFRLAVSAIVFVMALMEFALMWKANAAGEPHWQHAVNVIALLAAANFHLRPWEHRP